MATIVVDKLLKLSKYIRNYLKIYFVIEVSSHITMQDLINQHQPLLISLIQEIEQSLPLNRKKILALQNILIPPCLYGSNIYQERISFICNLNGLFLFILYRESFVKLFA